MEQYSDHHNEEISKQLCFRRCSDLQKLNNQLTKQ